MDKSVQIWRHVQKCRVPFVPPKRQWDKPTATTRGRERHAAPPPPLPIHRTPAAVSASAEEKRAPEWEEPHTKPTGNKGRPTHDGETSPGRTQSDAQSDTQGDHEERAPQQPPNAADAERAISNQPPPPPLPPPATRCPRTPRGQELWRAPGGARHRGGSSATSSPQRTGQSTSCGDVKSSCGGGGGGGGQEWVRTGGTQGRQRKGGGATQPHRTWEPHQEGRGRVEQARRRGAVRQGMQQGQREQGTRL